MGKEKGKDKRKEKDKPPENDGDTEMVEIAPPEEEHNKDYVLNERGIPVYPDVEVPTALESVASYDPKGPRLMISHITNENFKSYAGVQILGPFHKSFSSIVGPNGSGKSNVIDSMLFVFGYRANKIRSKKISILIHNSDQHPNVTGCTVTVHFQKIIDTGEGEDDYDLVPNSKFSVSRTAFKDNSSYYKINDRKATYKEVATLLRGTGIDLDHNRFLILQGEVEQISLMKPKAATEHDEGMLEFLEDIIGSNRFKVPIEQLCKRVEHLSEVRIEKLNRVKAVEKEKDDLEGVKNEALEYLRKENEVVRKKNMLYQKYVSECHDSMDKAKKKQEEIQEGMKDVTERLKVIEENKKEKGKEIKETYKKYEKLTKSSEEKKEEFSKFEQQDVRCREQLKHTKSRAKKLDKQVEQEKKKLEELKAIPEKMERDVVDYKKKLEKLETEKTVEEEKLKEVMESLKTETQGLQQEKEAKETELIDLERVVNETRSKFNMGQAELDLFKSNQRSEETKLKDTERNLETATKNLQEKQKAVKESEKKLPELEQKLIKAQKDMQNITTKETAVVESVRTTRVKVEEVRTTLHSARSRGKVLDALMAEKRAGRIAGIYGRLGDLGAIEERYDVAISTACGALDNILVDSIDTAQKCVEFLKKSGAGFATFIGLDKMERWKGHCNQRITTPENVPRLFDLVKTNKEEVLPAFYFALRDTLVANDLDQATRIAYGRQRYRVVTLQGQLIDTSGTMSGGGGRVAKGRMGSTVIQDVNPAQLDKLEAQLKKETAEAQTLRAEKSGLEELVRNITVEINNLKRGIDKAKMELKALPDQVKSLTQQKKECEERVKAAAPDEKTLKKMEKQVDADKKEFDKAKEAASKVQDEVHELHKQIMEIGGSKLKAAESKVNMVSNQIDQVMGHITKANVSIKTSVRNATTSENKVKSLEEEIKENKEALETLEVEFKKLEEDATRVLEAFQKAQEDMKEVEEELNGKKKEMAALEVEEEKLEKDNVEVKHELEKYETIVKENASKIKHWNKELGKISLHKIEGGSITSDGEDEDEGSKELQKYEAEYLLSVKKDETQYAITILEEKLASMKPNMAAIAEYKKKEEMYLQRVADLDLVTEMRNDQRRLHDDLRKQRLDEFMTGFSIITNKLKEMYQMITLGGDAELELVDSLDPFSEGIVFSVRPPKKSWKVISSLSGGEKTLSSLALVFALHHYKPTPLYVMDEIDAALDFKNVSIVANYIKERTKNAQFIIISLRNNMFELADRLIGIYKTYNATKSVTINPQKINMPLPVS